LGVLGLVHTLSTVKPTDELDHVVAPLVLCTFGILPAIGVTLWRLLVPVPKAVPLPRVWYLQSVSVVVLFFMAQTRGLLCRSCSHLTFLRMTFWTLVGSPWGIVGILVGPWYILSNVLFLVRTFWPTLHKHQANGALAAYRDYAANLLRTKDESTVVDVLHKHSGVPHTEIAAYLSKLRAELLKQ
jgi:hypothetical protein